MLKNGVIKFWRIFRCFRSKASVTRPIRASRPKRASRQQPDTADGCATLQTVDVGGRAAGSRQR
jgi:hypothetical protein